MSYAASTNSAVGAQLIPLHGDAGGGLELSLDTSQPVRIALVRFEHLFHQGRYEKHEIRRLIRAMRSAGEWKPSPAESSFAPIGPDSAVGTSSVTLGSDARNYTGFDALLILPIGDEPFDMALAFSQRRHWEVSRGHHGQCVQLEPQRNHAAHAAQLVGTIVPLGDVPQR